MDVTANDANALVYAGFRVRLHAALYDTMLFFASLPVALAVAIATGSDLAARVIAIVYLTAVLLYEPVLVSLRGCTLGHHRFGLRVIEDSTGGNVGFIKSVARFVIKTTLGWLSDISMLASRRRKAIHDGLTRSSVILDGVTPELARAIEAERAAASLVVLPSVWRRIGAMLAYGIGSFGLLVAAVWALMTARVLSVACVETERCTPFENSVQTGIGIIWLAGLCLVLAFAWKGMLPGARAPKAGGKGDPAPG